MFRYIVDPNSMRADCSLDFWLSKAIFIISVRCVVLEENAFFLRGTPLLASLGSVSASASARLGPSGILFGFWIRMECRSAGQFPRLLEGSVSSSSVESRLSSLACLRLVLAARGVHFFTVKVVFVVAAFWQANHGTPIHSETS